MTEIAELDKRLALTEQKLDLIINNHLAHLADDITEIRHSLEAHRIESKKTHEQMVTKFDRLLWAVLVGMTGIVIKVFIFSGQA